MQDQSMNPYLREKVHINGQWRDGESGKALEVFNPGNGKLIGTVPRCGPVDVLQAIDAAKAAFGLWSSASVDERAERLWRMRERLLAQKEALAEVITMENGKPIREALGEVSYTADYFRWYAEEARRIYGETLPQGPGNRRMLVRQDPVGVCAMITPWNFPLAMLGRKAAAALAAGCTLVAKPAEETPFSALALAAIGQEAGLPHGALNVVTGEPDPIGQLLCASPEVRKLSFTGSSQIGRLLMGQCSTTLKRVSLELGGNAPFIVFEDADIDAAVEGAMASKFRNGGQTCIASNRFLVHRDIAPSFVQLLLKRMNALQVGNGMDPGTDIGPMISREAVEKVRALVRQALEMGAQCHTGNIAEGDGLFVDPILLTEVNARMNLWTQEIFGPVVAISTFDSDEMAISLANDTEHGLAAYVYTEDAARCWTVPEALEFGMVGLNTGTISSARAPFGGIKQSGMGREGSHHGLRDYLQTKYVCQGL
jgi:succinate-semialdehyde dehydrogenase / glutarate-semialdehyde dehydrogenase